MESTVRMLDPEFRLVDALLERAKAELARESLRKRLEVTNDPRTNILRLRATGTDDHRSAEEAQEWILAYKDRIGEIVSIPTTPAITNAIFNATGVRVTRLPVDQDWLLRQMKRQPTSNA